MKFVCTHGNLLRGVSAVSPLAGRNPQLPVLQHVLLEVREGVLHLTCTDLEVGAHVVVAGKAESEGSCTVAARQLVDYIQQLPEGQPIELEMVKGRLRVGTQGFQAHFPVSASDDFPLLPVPEDTASVMLDGRLLGQALQRTLFAAARDEARPEIHSLFLQAVEGELRLAATDSFRLAEQVLKLEGEAEFSLLLPLACAQEVTRLFGGVEQVELLRHDRYVAFRADGVELSSRLVDGSYPDYRQIIPQSFKTQGVVTVADLQRALKVAGVFLSRDLRRVRVQADPGNDRLVLEVEGGELGEGEVEVPFEGTGDNVEALFNITYLLEGVQHMTGDSCELRFGGESDPVMLRPVQGVAESLYIVMPIQV